MGDCCLHTAKICLLNRTSRGFRQQCSSSRPSCRGLAALASSIRPVVNVGKAYCVRTSGRCDVFCCATASEENANRPETINRIYCRTDLPPIVSTLFICAAEAAPICVTGNACDYVRTTARGITTSHVCAPTMLLLLLLLLLTLDRSLHRPCVCFFFSSC